MRYLSLFSGIEAATTAWHRLGWQPLAFSEIEPFPCEVLQHHYPHVPNLGDVTKFKEWPDLGTVDLVVGGAPCQAFSVAGLRAGLADPRGNLTLTYLAVIDRYRPQWVLFENVPGILSSTSDDAPDPSPPPDPVDMGLDGQEVVIDEQHDAEETHAFSAFLAGLRELGYGFAYRVLDAQFVRVDGFPHAVPQRRRRVFVVGYLGDWRRAAAVFFDGASLRGDSPPRREAGQGVAPTISARTKGGGGLGTDFDLDGGLISNSGEVGYCLTASAQQSLDAETETLVATAAPAITSNPYGDHESREGLLVAHALRAEGFDASEDGSGRGTPIVPVAQPIVLMERGRNGEPNLETRQDGTANAILTPNGGRGGLGVGAIAFDTTQITSKANRSVPKDGDPCHPLAAGAHAPAIAIQAGALRENPASGPDGVGVQEGIAYTVEARAEVQAVAFDARQSDVVQYGDKAGPLDTDAFSQAVLTQQWAVRRLTPKECERLQGFPDGYTDIPRTNGKAAADGPRYKALGNSMAVNAMAWIGERIAMVDAIAEAEAAA